MDDSHRPALGESRALRVDEDVGREGGKHVQAAQLLPAPDAEAGGEAPAPERVRSAGRRWWTLFSHPLLLLLLGAALTAWVTNGITHQWQKRDRELEVRNDLRQKELQVKASLARSIGESIGAILATMHSTELTTHGKPGPAYDRAYQDWIVSSNGIDSQIRVYFQQGEINEEWTTYVASMRTMYYVLKYEGRAYEQKRLNLLREINLYLKNSGLGSEELKEIARFRARPGEINLLLDLYFRRLLENFRERANELIKTILGTRSVLTDETPERRSPAVGNESTARWAGASRA